MVKQIVDGGTWIPHASLVLVLQPFSDKLPQNGVSSCCYHLTTSHSLLKETEYSFHPHTALPKLLFLRLTMTSILLNLVETSILILPDLGQAFLSSTLSSHYFHYSRAPVFHHSSLSAPSWTSLSVVPSMLNI